MKQYILGLLALAFSIFVSFGGISSASDCFAFNSWLVKRVPMLKPEEINELTKMYDRLPEPVQQRLKAIIDNLPSRHWLWGGRVTARLRSLASEDLVQVLTLLANGDLPRLMTQAATDVTALSLNEQRAVVLAITQNWTFVERIKDGRGLARVARLFSVSAFLEHLGAHLSQPVGLGMSLDQFLRSLDGSESLAMRLIKGRSEGDAVFEAIKASAHIEDLLSGLQKRLVVIEQEMTRAKGISRRYLWYQREQLKNYIAALSPEYSRMLREVEGWQAWTRSLYFKIFPRAGHSASQIVRSLVVTAAIFWGYHMAYSAINDPSRPPLFIDRVPAVQELRALDTGDPDANILYGIQERYFAGELSREEYQAAFARVVKNNLELGWE